MVIILITMTPASLRRSTMRPMEDRRKTITVRTIKHTTCRDNIVKHGTDYQNRLFRKLDVSVENIFQTVIIMA